MIALVLASLAQAPAQAPSLALAESLLQAGRLPEARRIAEQLEDRNPRDAAVLIVLGRIHLAWPVIGRYAAESLLTRAIRLDSLNPLPWYLIGDVGAALGGEDGEEFIRRGMLGAIGINPGYRDAWERWEAAWRTDGERRRMLAALERHEGSSLADLRRGQLLVELDSGAWAANLLEAVTRQRARDPAAWAWYARALFEAGQDSAGSVAYRRALELADLDSARLLWRQVRGTATGAERLRFANLEPGQYASFLRLFWARRDPDLASPVNLRFAEHFRRLTYATRKFALLHGTSRYFRSAEYRALAGGVGGVPDAFGDARDAYRFASELECGAPRRRFRDRDVQAGFSRVIDTTSGALHNLEDRVDDRGRMWIRHGRPDFRYLGPRGLAEVWCYRKDRGMMRIGFMRRTGGQVGTGDYVLTALVGGDDDYATELLATEGSGARGNLAFAFWYAFFRSTDSPGTSELALFTDSLDVVAVLLDEEGRELARGSAAGTSTRLPAPPGQRLLMIDGHRGDRIGRYRGAVQVPAFNRGLAVSSVVLAPSAAIATRDAVLAAVPRDLVFSARSQTRAYAEVYGLGAADGTTRYRAAYRFERLDGFIFSNRRESVVTISFDREVPAQPYVRESLLMDPGQLPAGRYRVDLVITDLGNGGVATSAPLEFRLR